MDQTSDGRFWIGGLTQGRLIRLDADGNVAQSIRFHSTGDYLANPIVDVEGLADNGLYALLAHSPIDQNRRSGHPFSGA